MKQDAGQTVFDRPVGADDSAEFLHVVLKAHDVVTHLASRLTILCALADHHPDTAQVGPVTACRQRGRCGSGPVQPAFHAATSLVGESKYMLGPGGRTDAHNFGWASTIRGGTSSVVGTLTAANLPINEFQGHGNNADTMFGSASVAAPPQGHGVQMRMFGSTHTGGCHMLMADGSAHFIGENIDINIHQQLGVRDDELPNGGFTP